MVNAESRYAFRTAILVLVEEGEEVLPLTTAPLLLLLPPAIVDADMAASHPARDCASANDPAVAPLASRKLSACLLPGPCAPGRHVTLVFKLTTCCRLFYCVLARLPELVLFSALWIRMIAHLKR